MLSEQVGTSESRSRPSAASKAAQAPPASDDSSSVAGDDDAPPPAVAAPVLRYGSTVRLRATSSLSSNKTERMSVGFYAKHGLVCLGAPDTSSIVFQLVPTAPSATDAVCYGDKVILIDVSNGHVFNLENTRTWSKGYLTLSSKSTAGEAHVVITRATAPYNTDSPILLSDVSAGGRVSLSVVPARAGTKAAPPRALTLSKKETSAVRGGYLMADGSGAAVSFDLEVVDSPPADSAACDVMSGGSSLSAPSSMGSASISGTEPLSGPSSPAPAQRPSSPTPTPAPATGASVSGGVPSLALPLSDSDGPAPTPLSPLLVPVRYGDRIRLHSSSSYYRDAAVTAPDRVGAVGVYLKHGLVAMGPTVAGADAGLFIASEFTVLPAPSAPVSGVTVGGSSGGGSGSGAGENGGAGAVAAALQLLGQPVRHSTSVVLVDAQGAVWNTKATGTWGDIYLAPIAAPATAAAAAVEAASAPPHSPGGPVDSTALARAVAGGEMTVGEVHISFQPLSTSLQGAPVLAAPAGKVQAVLLTARAGSSGAAIPAAAGGVAIDIEYSHRKATKFNTRVRAFKRPTSQLVGGYLVSRDGNGNEVTFAVELVAVHNPAAAAAAALEKKAGKKAASGAKDVKVPARVVDGAQHTSVGGADSLRLVSVTPTPSPPPFLSGSSSARRTLALSPTAAQSRARVAQELEHEDKAPVSPLPSDEQASAQSARAALSRAGRLGLAAVIVAALSVLLMSCSCTSGSIRARGYLAIATLLSAAASGLAMHSLSSRPKGAAGAGALLAHAKKDAKQWEDGKEARAAKAAVRAHASKLAASHVEGRRASEERSRAAVLAQSAAGGIDSSVDGETEGVAGHRGSATNEHSRSRTHSHAQGEGEEEAEGAEGAEGELDIDDPSVTVVIPYDPEEEGETPPRYVKAEKGNAVSGRARFLKTMQWRARNGLDRMLFREHPMFRFIKQNTHQFFAGKGREGNCVYYEQPKKANLPAFTKAGVTIDELLYHFVYITEFLYQRLDTNPDAKCISVVDCAGIGLSDFGGAVVDFVKKISAVTQTHYPERSFSIICINAPWSFRMVWAIVRKMMDPVTRDKTHIYGSDYLKQMSKVVASDQVPAQYGGTLSYTPSISPSGPALPETSLNPMFNVDIMPLSHEEEELFKIADKYNAAAAERWPDRPLVRGALTDVEPVPENSG